MPVNAASASGPSPLSLPASDRNIFHRIIRNPRPESPAARERECTEMLCAVLANAPLLRTHLLRFMAVSGGHEPLVVENLEFTVDTEGRIGSKRDDLRITGHESGRRDGPPLLLWSVEVKVGATFHLSSHRDEQTDKNEDTPEPDADPTFVNQLLNYDGWLAGQPVQHRAGFVLSVRDMRRHLPEGLRQPWACLTWTSLCGAVEKRMLARPPLPPEEMMLAAHLAGFVRANLWRNSEMTDARITFDDIALIRAYVTAGKDAEQRLNDLVFSLAPVFEQAGIGHGKVTEYPGLYRTYHRSAVWRYLIPGAAEDPHPAVTVSAGFEPDRGDFVCVNVDVGAKHPKLEAVKAAVEKAMPGLRKRDARWTPLVDDEISVLELRMPLTSILAANDQAGLLADIARKAMDDLKTAGVLDAVIAAAGGPGGSKKR